MIGLVARELEKGRVKRCVSRDMYWKHGPGQSCGQGPGGFNTSIVNVVEWYSPSQIPKFIETCSPHSCLS